jgi:dGTPase
MEFDWNRLLSDWRCPTTGKSAAASNTEEFRTPFEADYDRIVYSPPFRRLARKTQVHSMAPNDHVHNRLTHSIEVASVGRSLARRLSRFLVERNLLTPSRADDISHILQAACLAHDIGNPPFGHGGEYAVRQWVRNFPEKIFGNADSIAAGVRRDWELFEGNAQGFRLAARADNAHTGYMRLTYATLSTMIKYPWDSLDPRATQRQKFNVFSTEVDLFRDMSQQMGLVHSDQTIARHPLSFLSEAADDICYRILDLEDAVEMGILDERLVRPVMNRFLEEDQAAKWPDRPLPILRGAAISALVDQSWQVFEQNYAQIMAGERTQDLKSQWTAKLRDALAEVDEHYNTIFAYRSKVANELGAYTALGRIIETVCYAARQLAATKNYSSVDFLAKRTLQLVWGEAYATKNQQQDYTWWLHQVMDYLASLTDNYARQLSREIAGV